MLCKVMKRVALITGASGGIGLECCKKFAKNGYSVCAVDVASTHELMEIVSSSGGIYFSTDVSDYEESKDVAGKVFNKFGALSVLVTCAGISSGKDILDISVDEWSKVIKVNLNGTFNYIKAVAFYMKDQGYGKIITISSTVAQRARRNISAYTASKAAVVGLTKAAARDLGRYNITVNCISPGLTATSLVDAIPDKIKSKLVDETCLGRIANPSQIADAVYMLSSDDSSHITGEVIRVDGGQLA
ncbi:MAG: SDR family oxidoreductase [Planctomycetes bacterium]|nr:SDR family oxidoreductase [Planctomycetota bacterium]